MKKQCPKARIEDSMAKKDKMMCWEREMRKKRRMDH